MRVLHVMEATIGGTRRHLVDIARGQRARGLDVHLAVATSRDPDFLADLEALEREGVGVMRLPMVRELAPWRDWRDYSTLVRLLKELQPEIVHTHSSKAGVLGRQASITSGVGRRVHTPHTFAFLFDALFGPLKRRLFKGIERHLALRTARVIAVSPSEANSFETSGVVQPEKIRVVPNGIDPARFQGVAPLDLGSLGLDPARPVAAVIGLVYQAKGQDLALEALVGAGCDELQLLIVGPGDLGELRAQAARLGVQERVFLTGPRRDVPALLAAVDFLILPSRWEGMPYIVLEAMASGRAVLATPVDGALDLVRDGESGRLADGISAEALGAGMAELVAMGAAARNAWGARGRELALAEHGLEAMLDGVLEVYREL